MGWERRRRGGLYYYKAVRIGGKPRRIYLGAGACGRVHELLDRKEARKKVEARAVRDRDRDQSAEAKGLFDEAWRWARTIAAAALVAEGFYPHHGQWRPVRGPARKKFHVDTVDPGPLTTALDRLKAVTARAAGRDGEALAALRLLLADDSGVWAAADAALGSAVACWRARVAARHGLDVEDLARLATTRADALVGADPPAAERALAAAANVQGLAFIYASNLDETTGSAERFRLKLLQSAARRLDTVKRESGLVRAARSVAAKAVSAGNATSAGPARRAAG